METRDETIKEQLPQQKFLERLTKAAASFASYVASVQKAWLQTFVCGLVVPMIVGFIFLYIIKLFAGCIVWTSIILLEICFIFGAIVAMIKAGVFTLPEEAKTVWESVCICSACIRNLIALTYLYLSP